MDERDEPATPPSADTGQDLARPPAWQRLAFPLRAGLLALSALVLLATGAGLALALEGAVTPQPSSNAGLYSASSPSGFISPATTGELARRLDPAVVDIDTVVETASGSERVAGTGMIVKASGLVVTNNHVVEGARRITVRTSKGARLGATFVGADPATDVAVLRIEATRRFPTVRLGDSSRIAIGESVLAFGNALGLGGLPAVTGGTVSALDRSITAKSDTGEGTEHLRGMVETDVPIEPGNSGGPLVDASGIVIGMNTAAFSGGNATAAPFAFAIPINRVLTIARRIVDGASMSGIVLGRRAYLGIEGSTIALGGSDRRSAVNVVQVEPSTPAASSGLSAGDLITAIDHVQVTSMTMLTRLIDEHRPGQCVTVTYEAEGVLRTRIVSLTTAPAA